MIELSLKAVLNCSAGAAMLAVALMSTPALADDETESSDPVIIVTGTHLRPEAGARPSAFDILSREDRILSGVASTSALIQGATVASGSSQITGSSLNFVNEGGPAAETIGLRGLNAARTLVLLNGRRLAPAGAGPKLIAADLNVLPTALVQRVEVLREGASSIYGSDAIAGVVNVITDTEYQGIGIDLFTTQPLQYRGGAQNYRVSLTAGQIFERGHITAAFEFREREGLRVGDRKDFSCPRDLIFNPATGAEVGQIDPATGQLACFPYALNSGVGIASGYGIARGLATGSQSRLAYVGGNINQIASVDGLTLTSPSPVQLQNHVISPVRTWTGYLNGAYELGGLGNAELYAEALFTRRESRQDYTYQINLANLRQLSPNAQLFGGFVPAPPPFPPLVPVALIGAPASPFFPNSVASDPRLFNTYLPFIIPDQAFERSQRVDYLTANGGLRGELGIGDWRYDANFHYSHTRSRTSELLIETARLNNALQSALAPAGTPANLITTALPGQAAAGTPLTCRSNLSAGQLIAGANCVPFNIYDPAILVNGRIPGNVFNYLFTPQTGRTTFDQSTIALNFDGTLAELPAGPLRAAIGYEHRHDKINDVPSLAAQADGIFNFSTSGITRGADTVDEVYGELGVPILADKPFARILAVNLSGRYTHYKSYGSDFTYHLNAQWAPNEVVNFRGNYGTSFRAPNLFEQFVGDQTSFQSSAVDPCNLFASVRAPTDPVYRNCLAQLTPILGAQGALRYAALNGPKVITRGGRNRLKAETSKTWGFGSVLNVSPGPVDVTVSVDYWNITVKNEVFLLNNLILNRCYEAADFPNNQFCALIGPRLPAAAGPAAGTLDVYINPYLNISRQKAAGIDFDLLVAGELGAGRFAIKARATRNIDQKFQLFTGTPIQEFNGTLGTQGFGAGPKWVADFDVRYVFASDKITLRYGVKYVGKQDSTALIGPFAAGLGIGPVDTDFVAEAYWEHAISLQYRIDEASDITLGVSNLFNEKPPTISQIANSRSYSRIGNYFNSSNYDFVGRSLFLNVSRRIK